MTGQMVIDGENASVQIFIDDDVPEGTYALLGVSEATKATAFTVPFNGRLRVLTCTHPIDLYVNGAFRVRVLACTIVYPIGFRRGESINVKGVKP